MSPLFPDVSPLSSVTSSVAAEVSIDCGCTDIPLIWGAHWAPSADSKTIAYGKRGGDCRVWGKSTVRPSSCSAGYGTWHSGKTQSGRGKRAAECREEEEMREERETGGGEGWARPHWSFSSLKGRWNLTSNAITSPFLSCNMLHSAKQTGDQDEGLCHFEVINLTQNIKSVKCFGHVVKAISIRLQPVATSRTSCYLPGICESLQWQNCFKTSTEFNSA